ncbi:hypothetical protein MBLNU457_7420t1 [Dothideomycetes sp. NU457]
MAETVDPVHNSQNAGVHWTEPLGTLCAQLDGLLAISILFLISTTVANGLRLFTRIRILRSAGFDDWAILVSQIFFWTFAICLCVVAGRLRVQAVELAAGQQESNQSTLNLFVAVNCFYDLTMIALKSSIGFLLLRIFTVHAISKYIIYATVTVAAFLGLLNIGYTLARPCQLWTQFFPGIAKCSADFGQEAQWFATEIAWAVWNAFSDLILATLSIMAIISLQLPQRTKVSACLLLAFGTVGGLASIIRIGILIPQIPGTSILGESINPSIWTVIEPGLGITAASLATLRPLVRKLSGRDSASEEPYPKLPRSRATKAGGILAVKSVEQIVSSRGLEEGLILVQISGGPGHKHGRGRIDSADNISI